MATTTNVALVDDASFDSEVLAAEVPVLVEFVGQWCGPCKAMAPIVDLVAAEIAGRAKVVTVDADESPATARRYGIRGVPTLLVFRNGEKTAQHVGTTTKAGLLALLER
jgi:thioredoxin 1